MTSHRCYSHACPACEAAAETRKENDAPDYDESAAADQYERQFES